MYQVYILKCSDGHPYVGCTNNLKDRVDRHNKGHVPATKNRVPVKLIFCASFGDKYKAFEFEKISKIRLRKSVFKQKIDSKKQLTI